MGCFYTLSMAASGAIPPMRSDINVECLERITDRKMSILDKLKKRRKGQNRPHLNIDSENAVVFAIGDVHGCLDELLTLEQQIISNAGSSKRAKWIVMLGDYIDRGPQSAQVIEHLLADPPEGFKRICLCGNHEVHLLEALQRRGLDHWFKYGGLETLKSYGIDPGEMATQSNPDKFVQAQLQNKIPSVHLDFLQKLPVLLETTDHIMVHAGLRPGVMIADQTDRDLMSIRDDFLFSDYNFGKCVVHGHTPVDVPDVKFNRINVDTRAFASGRLTALKIEEKGAEFLISDTKLAAS